MQLKLLLQFSKIFYTALNAANKDTFFVLQYLTLSSNQVWNTKCQYTTSFADYDEHWPSPLPDGQFAMMRSLPWAALFCNYDRKSGDRTRKMRYPAMAMTEQLSCDSLRWLAIAVFSQLQWTDNNRKDTMTSRL